MDCAIRDRPGSWPTPEHRYMSYIYDLRRYKTRRTFVDVICHDPVRPTLVQFVLEIIARYETQERVADCFHPRHTSLARDVDGAAWPTNEAIVWELPHWPKVEQRYRLLSWESVTA